MQFKDIIAQDALKAQLIASARSGKVSQAMLFLGPEGAGMLPMALAYAQYLNCENQQENDSCGNCNACNKAAKWIHPDIYYTYPTVNKNSGKPAIAKDYITEWRKTLAENPYINVVDWVAILDKENKQGNITAAECDQIVRQHSLKHYEGKYKIQLIWMAEFLKIEGNKLLKILEEPPENTVFLLIAENIEEILVTILSRTQVVKFARISDVQVAKNLEDRLHIDAEKARKIAQIVDGNWYAATQLAQTQDEQAFEELFEWFYLLLETNKTLETIEKLVNWVEKAGGMGRESQKLFLKHTLFFLRECLIFDTGLPSKLNDDEKNLALEVRKRLSLEELYKISQLLNNLHYEIFRNANAKIGLMNASFEIAGYLNGK
jgi:DNA polymerase-3 subunit delta'